MNLEGEYTKYLEKIDALTVGMFPDTRPTFAICLLQGLHKIE